MTTETTPHYAAFISYAHADEAMAARLHKALETYPVPKHLRSEGREMQPIFRDVAELTAAHSLSEKIREAVKNSRVLIVLCSPASRASHWVNEEIKLFREIHGDATILSAIIEGTPDESFPEALIEEGREPLAASLGTGKAGFKLGVTQLAAGMLSTGLDELVQRGARRRTRLMGGAMAASLALSGIMGFATYQAVDARDDAEESRNDAEALVEYMITDLKRKLEPVQKLDILEGVGDEVIEYYAKQDQAKMPDDRLLRQAEAFHLLGDVALDTGRIEDSKREFETALAITKEVLGRNPEDVDAIYAHAQSSYWVGEFYSKQREYVSVKPYWEDYNRLGQKLYEKDPNNFSWVMEAGWGANNLGLLANNLFEYELGRKHYDSAIQKFERAIEVSPKSKGAKKELANAFGGAARSELIGGTKDEALSFRLKQIETYSALIVENPDDVYIEYRLAVAKDKLRRDFVDDESTNLPNTLGLDVNETLKVLVNHDPENVDWQEALFKDNFRLLYKYSIAENFGAMEGLYNDAATQKKQYFKYNSTPDIRDEFYADLMPLLLLFAEKNIEQVSSSIIMLNAKYIDINGNNIQLSEIFSTLWELNSLIERNEDAKKFANLFLESNQANSIPPLPALIRKKIKILWYLDKKEEARVLNRALSNRGFSAVAL